MSAFYRFNDDNCIWFNEEDPDDELYNPKCCRNVYLDNVCGYFDYQYDASEYDYDGDYYEEED
jgi:hypothetical protein